MFLVIKIQQIAMIRYNVYLQANGRTNTLTLLTREDLEVVLDAYADGLNDFFIHGKKVEIAKLQHIIIFNTEISDNEFDQLKKKREEYKKRERFGLLIPTWDEKVFSEMGNEITRDLIQNNAFGWRKGLTLINNSEQLTNTFWHLIHDKIKAVAKPRFDSKQYADAVEASFKELNDIIKQEYKSKTGNELDGQKLMNQAFSTNSPTFELVDLSNQSGQNIQEGYRFILAGSMCGIRNPKAHQNLVIDQNDAIEKIILASHLLKAFERRLN